MVPRVTLCGHKQELGWNRWVSLSDERVESTNARRGTPEASGDAETFDVQAPLEDGELCSALRAARRSFHWSGWVFAEGEGSVALLCPATRRARTSTL